MLEMYLLGFIGVMVVGIVAKEYHEEIAEFIMKKIEEE